MNELLKVLNPTIFIDHDGFVDVIYNNTHTSRISKYLQRNSESPSKNSLLIANISEHWPGKHYIFSARINASLQSPGHCPC